MHAHTTSWIFFYAHSVHLYNSMFFLTFVTSVHKFKYKVQTVFDTNHTHYINSKLVETTVTHTHTLAYTHTHTLVHTHARNTLVHIRIRTHTHTHLYTHTHSYTYVFVHTHTHTHTRIHIRTPIHTHLRTHHTTQTYTPHTCICTHSTHTHTQHTHTHSYTLVHTHIRTPTHTHICVHPHTCIPHTHLRTTHPHSFRRRLTIALLLTSYHWPPSDEATFIQPIATFLHPAVIWFLKLHLNFFVGKLRLIMKTVFCCCFNVVINIS